VPPDAFRLDSETETQLKVFFTAKEQQARKLKAVDESFYAEATTKPDSLTKGLAPEVWPYFAAGKSGDWKKTKKLYLEMAARVLTFPRNGGHGAEKLRKRNRHVHESKEDVRG